jgi:hypothetical protein
MNSLRGVVKPAMNNQDIVFNVQGDGVFNVKSGWVWMQGSVELRGGGVPVTDPDSDGAHFEALLHKDGGQWKVLNWGVGSTDVWWWGIASSHPDAPDEIWTPSALGDRNP